MSKHTNPLGGLWQVTESGLWLSDNTIADVSTTRHGLVPKAPNDTSKFLRGDGTWATPIGTSGNNELDIAYLSRKATLYDEDDFWHSGSALDTTGARFTGAQAWTTRNFGAASESIARRELRLQSNATVSASWAQAYMPVPSGSSRFRAEVAIEVPAGAANSTVVGMHLRDSGSSKLEILWIGVSGANTQVTRARWTNDTTFSANVTALTLNPNIESSLPAWLEIEIDATNYTFRYSLNGIKWFKLGSATSKTAFLTTAADEIGLCSMNTANRDTILVCHAWYRVA